MAFDPTVYQEPNLPDEKWIERFIAHLILEGAKQADESFKPEIPTYAAEIAKSYLADRKDYASPEEAADTDLSYWEDDE